MLDLPKDWSNISYNVLGSVDLHNQLLTDIYELMDKSIEEKLCPLYLEIGNLFIDVGICAALKEETGIENWHDYVIKSGQLLRSTFPTMRREVLESIDTKSNGTTDYSLNRHSDSGLRVFYNPEEYYVSLAACHPKKKAQKGQPSTGDGYLIVTLRLSESEILKDYIDLLNNT